MRIIYLAALLFLISSSVSFAQMDIGGGSVTGNFKLDAQSYSPDSVIGAEEVSEKMLSNAYMNVIYKNGNFTAGVRFEGYLNTMLGYDKPYDGFGLATRYASYNGELFEVTAGNYYEQFGNGLIFRTYEDRDLGYDNAMDGFRVKFKPANGIVLTGIIGQQRIYWEKGEGIVRGIDGDFSLNEIIPSLAESANRISIGGSFVSKFQADEDPLLILPENVAAGAGRVNFSNGGFNLNAEYAYKNQDPSSDNNSIYKSGSALLMNANYSVSGLGFVLQYKWVDNMSFRSDRNAKLNNLSINYLPAISKNHTYAFAAMYPYATQVNGEAGVQAEVFYKFKKETFLGGEYGTLVSLNFSHIQDINRKALNASTPVGARATDGYTTSFLSMSDSLLSQDINVEISKKISSKVKGIFTYQHLDYNIGVLQGHGIQHKNMVNANAFIADITWKIKPKHSLRIETQAMFTNKVHYTHSSGERFQIRQDYGNWAMLMLEYSVSPHWFFALSDQYNYIDFDDKVAENTMNFVHSAPLNRNHYYMIAMGYSKGSSRVQLSYGKQREGILCVGGVCRAVPAAYGFNISVSTTF